MLLALPAVSFATVITGSPQDFSTPEAVSYSGPVANFSDDNPAATASDFNATIDWGDGSPTTAGTFAVNDTSFFVLGTHTYADEGTFTVTVTINDNAPGTGNATVTSTATVTENDVLSGTPKTFSMPVGVSATALVATFSDTDTTNTPGDFTATIDWGDATTSAGAVSGGSGTFQVNGTHTYATSGNFSVIVTLSDDEPGTATAQVTSTAVASSTVAATGIGISPKEHVVFNGPVATFTDTDTNRTASSFSASINWGDSTTTAGTITGSAGSFTVTGTHTYADEGNFPLSVTVTQIAPGTATATANATAAVGENDILAGTPVTFSPTVSNAFTGTVANFTDTDTANVAGDFVATIDWGDGTTTPGTVSGSAGSFHVGGTHTYASLGSFSVVVTLSDDAPGSATAKVTSTATVVNSSMAATAINIAPKEHTAFSGAVATFTDTNTSRTASSYTATINWGDGTTTPGTIAGSAGAFTVSGQHTYADEGNLPLGVTVTQVAPGTATASSSGIAAVAEADVLSGTPVAISATQWMAFSGAVANFTDTDTVSTSADFVATIQWGDGTNSAGVVSGGSGAFQVSGTHTYATPGNFSVSVTLSDDAPGTATATVTSGATVVAPPPAVPAPGLGSYGMTLLALLLILVGMPGAWRRASRAVGAGSGR
jgi:hypothetical protein